MSLTFQTLRSGSSANSLLLRSDSTTLLFDAGFRSQRACRDALDALPTAVDAVVVSHLHSDHINYSALVVLQEREVPLCVHRAERELLTRRHAGARPLDGVRVRPFTGRRFRVGDFTVQPFEVPHTPECTTFGFEVACAERGHERKIILASDLAAWRDLRGRFEDADFIYVEANHDPELLRRHPNPNSRYHLSNGQSGSLLRAALDHSRFLPVAVMLGHLSAERNRPELAGETVWQTLHRAGHDEIDLRVAPRHEPSEPVRIVP